MTRPAGGLEGVVAAHTSLSEVDGEAGRLVIGGYALEELAGRASFEEVVHLLWRGRLPTAAELAAFAAALTPPPALPDATVALLRAAAGAGLPAMDALRMSAATLELGASEPVAPAEERRRGTPEGPGATGSAESTPRASTVEVPDEPLALHLLRSVPALVAAYDRLSRGQEPVGAPAGLGLAASYLHMLRGSPPSAEEARALDTYLVTVVDHGLNASTFTARVIVSTRSDFTSALVGALGALRGPLHGGAPGPALDTVFEIGRPERAEEVLRGKLERGERLMGFGHRVYKVRDPRADVLSLAAERLYRRDGDLALFELARTVEETALRLLEERKPGRRLQTNVEFYTALLLHGLGLDTGLFTPTFAVGRTAGWLAHMMEQRRDGRLIRPASAYVGPRGLRWASSDERREPAVAAVP